jgi:hypothetical protein
MPHLDQASAERITKALSTAILQQLKSALRDLRDLDGLCTDCLNRLMLATLGTSLGNAAMQILGPADGAVYCAEVAAMVAEHDVDPPTPQPH